jgi:prepilin-type N-terminal cleavage/methylation domain-containing protein
MRHVNADDGFTLIETLLACAILATALLSVGHLSTAAVVLLMDSRGRTEATILAQSKLDELRSSAAPADGADTVDARGESARADSLRLFDRRWSVATVSTDFRILIVVVTPLSRGVAGREVRIAGGWTALP